jgi:hypothetical protein
MQAPAANGYQRERENPFVMNDHGSIGVPTLDGYTDCAEVAVWCDHEKKWHRHGRCCGLPGCANHGRDGVPVWYPDDDGVPTAVMTIALPYWPGYR